MYIITLQIYRLTNHFAQIGNLSIWDYYDSGPYANIALYDNSKVTISVIEDNEIDIKLSINKLGRYLLWRIQMKILLG